MIKTMRLVAALCATLAFAEEEVTKREIVRTLEEIGDGQAASSTIDLVLGMCVTRLTSFGDSSAVEGVRYVRSDSQYMRSLDYFFPSMQASAITFCQDIAAAPLPDSEDQAGAPNPTDPAGAQYKLLAGMQIQVNAEYRSTN